MSAAYFKAAIPEPFQILGLRLKVLSLGRYRSMHRFACGFVADGLVHASAGDLIIGLLICSMRVDAFLSWADSSRFSRDIRAWGRRCSPHCWVARIPLLGGWWRRRFGFDLREKLLLFRRYIEEGSATPRYWYEGDGSPGGAHWSHVAEVCLRSELGWSEEEINERPLSKALCDYLAWAEGKGSVRIMSDWEIAEIAKLEALNSKLEEKAAEDCAHSKTLREEGRP